MAKLMGTTKIELTDVKTGEKEVYENHNMVTNDGKIKTPRINSRMLLPLDIFATKTDTKAAQAAYHI